jgi:gag-polyprotein putative aspartyl protease/Sel1 repeat
MGLKPSCFPSVMHERDRSTTAPFWAAALMIVASVFPASAETIPMVKEGGVYEVPVEIAHSVTLRFVLDSGASDISIPRNVVQSLMRMGAIRQGDFIESQVYTLADGSQQRNQRFILRELKVGDHILQNITATVAPPEGALLLGQSFLSKLPRWSIDNGLHALIIGDDAVAKSDSSTSSPRRLQGQEQSAQGTFEEARIAFDQGDYAAALRRSKALAEQGDALSQIGMAYLYFAGKGVAQDYSEAAKWYRRAADQGNSSGQHSLGRMYAAGLGVERDVIAAYAWFNIAVANGDDTAIKSRDDLARKMTSAQILEAQRITREWRLKVE